MICVLGAGWGVEGGHADCVFIRCLSGAESYAHVVTLKKVKAFLPLLFDPKSELWVEQQRKVWCD